MVLEESKLQGVVGALLMAIGSAFPLIGIVGVALMLRAFKAVAEYYGENDMFRGVLRGLTAYLIGFIAFSAIYIYAAYAWYVRLMTPTIGPKTFLVPLLGGLIIVLIVVFACYLIGALLLRRSLEVLSFRSGEVLFSVAWLLLLIGAATSVIVMGFVITAIAWTIMAIAFYSLRPKPQVVKATP